MIGAWGMSGAVLTMVCQELLLALAPTAVLLLWQREYAATFSLWLVARWASAVACGWAASYWLGLLLPGTPGSGRVSLMATGAALAALGVLTALTVAWLSGVYEVRESLRRLSARLTRLQRLVP